MRKCKDTSYERSCQVGHFFGRPGADPSSAHWDPSLQRQVPHPPHAEEASDGPSREDTQACSIFPDSSSDLTGDRGMEGINPAALPGREHFFPGWQTAPLSGTSSGVKPRLPRNTPWHLISAQIIP